MADKMLEEEIKEVETVTVAVTVKTNVRKAKS